MNHAKNVDYFFDLDGAGPLAEIALSQNINQTLLADQLTTPGGVVWSGFYEIGQGLTLQAGSTFRVSGNSVVGGVSPQATTTAVWRFTAVEVATVPEPSTLVLLSAGVLGLGLCRGRGRTAG